MKELTRTHPVEVTVIAPVPWFPFKGNRFGHYGTLARVPRLEERNGITIYHPRYLVIPKIGMSVAAALMFLSVFLFVRRLHKQHNYDVLDGHFFYPDGVVVSMLGRRLKLPVMNTARGSDVALYPKFAGPRAQIRWAIKNSNAAISVCEFLSRELRNLVPESTHLHVMRNGVDLDAFQETDRKAMRQELGLRSFTLLTVGNLIELKGHHLVIEAMESLPDCDLLIAGEGPMKDKLARLIESKGLTDRVRLLGLIPHADLPRLYSAADCLILASSSEGWANVLLESMACGTPVVATRVAGNPEVVGSDDAGVLIDKRSATGIAQGVSALRAANPDRAAVRNYATGFSWQETSDKLFSLALNLAGKAPQARAEVPEVRV